MFLKKYLQLATLVAILAVACSGCVALDPYGRPVIVDPVYIPPPVVYVPPPVYIPPPTYYYYAPPVYYAPAPYYGHRHHRF